MYLSKNTNNIHLTVHMSDGAVPASAQVDAYMHGCNGLYDSQNKAKGNTMVTYLPHASSKVVTSTYDFTTLRLWIGDDLTMKIEQNESGKQAVPLATIPVTQWLAELENDNGEKLYDTDDKLEMEDEFNIEISLDGKAVIIGVKINGWYLIKPNVDL